MPALVNSQTLHTVVPCRTLKYVVGKNPFYKINRKFKKKTTIQRRSYSCNVINN